jgi:hypothetical protein
MTLDDILLKELARGPATVKEIAMRRRAAPEERVRLENRIRNRLDRLRVRGLVIKEWKGGHRQYTYRLPRSEG